MSSIATTASWIFLIAAGLVLACFVWNLIHEIKDKGPLHQIVKCLGGILLMAALSLWLLSGLFPALQATIPSSKIGVVLVIGFVATFGSKLLNFD